MFALAAVMAPTTLTPALQGWVTDSLSWSWVFALNLPLGIVALTAIRFGRDAIPPARKTGRFDAVGFALLAVAVTAAVYVLQRGDRWNWFGDPAIVRLTALAALALAAFVGWEIRRTRNGAMVDFTILRNPDYAFGFTVSFVAGFALFGSAFAIPDFALGVLRLTATNAGLLLLPSGALVGLGLLAAGALTALRGAKPFAFVPPGIVLFVAAMWMLSRVTAESGAPDMATALLVRGLGLGFLFISVIVVTFDRLEAKQIANGVGLFNFGRQFGGLLGVAFLQTWLTHGQALTRSVLISGLTPDNPVFAARQAAIASYLASRGIDPAQAATAALAVLRRMVEAQIAAVSFDHVFLAIGASLIVASPFLLTLKAVLAWRAK